MQRPDAGVRLEDLLAPTRTLAHVRFRAQKKMTAREELLAAVARDLEGYTLLEELLPEERRDFAFEEVKRKHARLKPGEQRARRAAADARASAGLDHAEPKPRGTYELVRDICGLLEDRGVKVITPVLASEGFFGLSIASEDGGPAVVVNTWERISVERWIFTAAHELGHLILHPGAYDVTKTEENEAEESEANLFASYFLMPPQVFDRELDDTRGLAFVDRVLKLKRIFHVSWQTVIYRMTEGQSQEKKSEAWKRFYFGYQRRTGRRLGKAEEPNPRIRPTNGIMTSTPAAATCSPRDTAGGAYGDAVCVGEAGGALEEQRPERGGVRRSSRIQAAAAVLVELEAGDVGLEHAAGGPG